MKKNNTNEFPKPLNDLFIHLVSSYLMECQETGTFTVCSPSDSIQETLFASQGVIQGHKSANKAQIVKTHTHTKQSKNANITQS